MQVEVQDDDLQALDTQDGIVKPWSDKSLRRFLCNNNGKCICLHSCKAL